MKIFFAIILLSFFISLSPAKAQEVPAAFIPDEISQDLTWGVLVVNTNMAYYNTSHEAEILMAVLDEKGEMVCDAELDLKIKNSQGEILAERSSKDKTIIVHTACSSKELNSRQDFETRFKIGSVGEHFLELTAKTKNGTRTVHDHFFVVDNLNIELERKTMARINPEFEYEVIVEATPVVDMKGTIVEQVPKEFEVKIQEGCSLLEKDLIKEISCPMDWVKEETYTFRYHYKAPPKSPHVYEIGPLKLLDPSNAALYDESRSWQIAVDPRIRYGTTTSVDANQGSRVKTIQLLTDRYVQCYGDNGLGQCRAGTVSGTTVSQGAEVTFQTSGSSADIALGTVPQSTLGLCKVSGDKFAVAYTEDQALDDGFVQVGRVNDVTIAFGTTTEFSLTDAESIGCAQLDDNRIVICFNDEGDATTDVGKCTACDVNPTTLAVACGANTDYNATDYFPYMNAPVNIGVDKFVVAFDEQEVGLDGEVVAATVAGTVITFGGVVTFDTDDVQYTNTCAPEDDDRFVIVYRDVTNTAGSIIPATVTAGAGTVITVGAEVDFNPTSEDVAHPGCTFIDANQVLVAYEDVTDSENGKTALCVVDWATPAVTCAPEQTFAALQIGSAASGGVDEQRGIATIAGYNTTTGKIAIGYIQDGTGDDTQIIIGDRAPLLGAVQVK
jgi:hypothetical protein